MSSFRDRYDLFIFDLDGTLVDSARDLASSLNHALGVLGRPPLEFEQVLRCVGRGARVLIERALGTRDDIAAVERGLAAFLEHYRDECVQRTGLFPGAAAALEGLAPSTRAVLTNKPIEPTLKILDHLGVREHFARVDGGDTVTQKKPSPDGLLDIAREFGVPPERTLLLGDTSVDLLAARAAGAAVALVPYGFEPESAWPEPPDYRLESLEALLGECPQPPTVGEIPS